MGVGIFTMHYMGLSALNACTRTPQRPRVHHRLLAIAIAASGLALWLAGSRGKRLPVVLSAIAFGIAVSGMHYTAIGRSNALGLPGTASGAPTVSTNLLAIVVAVVAFCFSLPAFSSCA